MPGPTAPASRTTWLWGRLNEMDWLTLAKHDLREFKERQRRPLLRDALAKWIVADQPKLHHVLCQFVGSGTEQLSGHQLVSEIIWVGYIAERRPDFEQRLG
jgi:hypothetical protein